MICKSAPLARPFYARPTVEVARDLLGKILVHGKLAAKIVETEAYLGLADAASHAFRGITPRTRVIFGEPGHAYVYLSYGIHDCLNIVAEEDGSPGCVLIRAAEPLAGIEAMRRRRAGIRRIEDLANGPGKLTKALAITLRHNGEDVTRGALTVHAPEREEPFETRISPRVGISKNMDWPLRFVIAGSRFASRP